MSFLGLNEASYIGRTTHDSLAISFDMTYSGLGPPSPQVVQAVTHLTNLQVPGEEREAIHWEKFDGVAREYYSQIRASDQSNGQLRIFLALLSGYFHELRHAHDFLATVYGQDALFLLMNSYQNLPSVLSALADWQEKEPHRGVPLPLRADLDGLASEVSQVIERYRKTNDRLRPLHEPAEFTLSSLSVKHLFETTATQIQLDFMHDLFGEQAVFELLDVIGQSKDAGIYLKASNEARDIFASHKFRGPGLGSLLNYLVWCSLMGLAPRGKTLEHNISPVIVFDGLVQHVSANCHEWDPDVCRRCVVDFCDRWGLYSPEEMVNRYRQVMSKRLESAAKTPKAESYSYFRRIAGCYRAFVKAYDRVHEIRRAQPEFWLNGRVYAWATLSGQFPSAHVTLRIAGELHDFVTHGRRYLSHRRWTLLNTLSMLLRVLVMGRGNTSDPVMENYAFHLLTERGWDGRPIRFEENDDIWNFS